MVAKTLKKPFYVAVESYKFARMYPLTQRDVRDMCLSATYDCNSLSNDNYTNDYSNDNDNNSNNNNNSINTTNKIENKSLRRIRSQSLVHLNQNNKEFPSFDHLNLTIDFTPAEFITLLFTDLGVLTPAAVSDELIRLYQ